MKDEDGVENTSYFTDNMNLIIKEQETHKDLGVLMSSSRKFSDHINNLVKKVKRKIGWGCRAFVSRDILFLRRIYNTYIHSINLTYDKGEIIQTNPARILKSQITGKLIIF